MLKSRDIDVGDMFTLEEISELEVDVGDTKPMEEYLETFDTTIQSKTPYSDVTKVKIKKTKHSKLTATLKMWKIFKNCQLLWNTIKLFGNEKNSMLRSESEKKSYKIGKSLNIKFNFTVHFDILILFFIELHWE